MRSLIRAALFGSILSLAACVGETPQVAPPGCETCGTECVDLKTDENHCGKCGAKCGAGEVCQASKCVLNCPADFLACGGKCVDPKSNAAFCGAKDDCLAGNAGTACKTGDSCVAGACTGRCSTGRLLCADGCIDPQTDRGFCGAKDDCLAGNAGVACPADQLCVAGQCACPSGQVACKGKCIDPKTSGAHCGAKGTCAESDPGSKDYQGAACTAGEGCSDGTCQACSANQVLCGASCIDPLTSVAFCGATGACTGTDVGTACLPGETCEAGTCKLTCANGQLKCGNKCVDPQTDLAFCGASGTCDGASAGTACGASEYCSGGTCTAKLSCAAGQVLCGTTCVAPGSDPGFCGAKGSCVGTDPAAGDYAGKACGPGEYCAAGTCKLPVACAAGQVLCGTTCISPASDLAACGAKGTCVGTDPAGANYAGKACAAGEYCAAGTCTPTLACAADQIRCGTKCVTPATDSTSCGAKGTCVGTDPAAANYAGKTCGASEYCAAGTCTSTTSANCPSGQIKCGSKCVDPLRDLNSCGAKGTCAGTDPAAANYAGKTCAFAESCFAGACKPVLFRASIPVEADTYLDASGTTNHGTEQQFIVDRDTNRALLRFDLSTLPAGAQIRSVALRAFVYTGYAYGGNGYPGFHFVSNDSWGETTVNPSNAPAPSPTGSTPPLATFGEVWFNNNINEHPREGSSGALLDVVQRENAGDGKVSFQIYCQGYRTNYRSREYSSGAKVATLEIDYTLSVAQSCQDLALGKPGTPDGDYTLYLYGDPARPYSAYCKDMATATPKTYLNLVNTGGNYNFSTWSNLVRSSYTRVRFDPKTRKVQIGDPTFATSTGTATTTFTFTSMPWGVAGGCGGTNGTANLNLVGTHFKTTNTWAGWNTTGPATATITSNGQIVDLVGNGTCNWVGPTPAIYQPMGAGTWWAIDLEYVP